MPDKPHRKGPATQRYESGSHIVVCEVDTFLGIVTIEELLLASADAKMESLMDRRAPIVAPGVDQEVAAWRAVRHGESALAAVDGHGDFVGMIPLTGCWEYSCRSTKKTSLAPQVS